MSQTISIVGGLVVAIFLVPVYVFLFLFYQPLLLDFIRKLFGETHKSQVSEVAPKQKPLYNATWLVL